MEDQEVAYVTVDVVKQWPHLVLYELYVLPACRGTGYGTVILAEVEALAVRLGFREVAIRPEPIDATHTRDELVAWYSRNGYAWTDRSNGFMLKRVSEAS